MAVCRDQLLCPLPGKTSVRGTGFRLAEENWKQARCFIARRLLVCLEDPVWKAELARRNCEGAMSAWTGRLFIRPALAFHRTSVCSRSVPKDTDCVAAVYTPLYIRRGFSEKPAKY